MSYEPQSCEDHTDTLTHSGHLILLGMNCKQIEDLTPKLYAHEGVGQYTDIKQYIFETE